MLLAQLAACQTREPESTNQQETRAEAGRGNAAQLEQVPAGPADPQDLARRLREVVVPAWEAAVLDGDLVEAEIQLAGVELLLRHLDPAQVPDVVGRLPFIESQMAELRQGPTCEIDTEGESLSSADTLSAPLSRDQPERVADLHRALVESDVQAAWPLLAGLDRPLRVDYHERHGQAVETTIHQHFIGEERAALLAYASGGGLGHKERLLALTVEDRGSEPDAVFAFLESIPLTARAALAKDPQVREALLELGSTGYERAFWSVYGRGADRWPHTLVVRLRAREQWFGGEDEAGMVEDVRAWSLHHGPVELDEVSEVLDWLEGRVSARDLLTCQHLLQTGGSPSLAEQVTEAGADTTLGFSDVDEAGLYAALKAADPTDRQALASDEGPASETLDQLDPPELDRAEALMESPASGPQLEGLDDLFEELNSAAFVHDKTVYEALGRLDGADLARLRGDPKAIVRLTLGVSDTQRLWAILQPPGSNARLVAGLEAATSGLDDAEDHAYRIVLEWQAHGGALDPAAHQEELTRARDALADLGICDRILLEQALDGMRALTWEDRLAQAVRGYGTDNTGLEDTLAELPDEVLVLEWSNLDQVQGSEDESFVPDISPRTSGLIAGDRADAVDLVGQLRRRLIEALEDPQLVQRAAAEFGYEPGLVDTIELGYADRSARLGQQREGARNALSNGLMDPWEPHGKLSEQSFGECHGATAAAVRAEDGSEREAELWAAAQEPCAVFEADLAEYAAAKDSAARIAGAVAGAVAGLVATVLSGGTAGALIAAVSASLLDEAAQAAIRGEDYDADVGAQQVLGDIAAAVVTVGMGPLADRLSKGAMASDIAKELMRRVGTRLGPQAQAASTDAVTEALTGAIQGFPGSVAKDLVVTEGLLREEFAGMDTRLAESLGEGSLELVAATLTHWKFETHARIDAAKAAGDWDALSSELAKKGLVDELLAGAAASVASGEMPDGVAFVELLCKLAETPSTASRGAAATRISARDALAFYNLSSAEELATAPHISQDLASAIVQRRRDTGGFRRLADVLAVPDFKTSAMEPVAAALLSDYETLRLEAHRGDH